MKRILIVINGFEIGGITVSLNSLLSNIEPSKLEVDVFARQQKGDYFGTLPNCNLLKENIWLSHSIYHRGKIRRIVSLLLLLFRKGLEKMGLDLYRLFNKIGGRQIRSLNYDAIIGFDESLSHYISLLPAKKRICWIHCDYRRYVKGKNESKYYDKIDTIVCVSESMRKVFCDYYPNFSRKTVTIHNIIDIKEIRRKAELQINDTRFIVDDFTMVSCGRLDPVKQFSLIPEIASNLKKKTNKKFKWFIIGDGEDRENIYKTINKFNVEDCVIPLGKKANPYPYIIRSDVFVCTSYSEAHPLVVNEARALCIPVICNTFESANESIIDGTDGLIVPIANMHNVIADFMQRPMNISKCQIDNEDSLMKFYDII